MFVHVVKMGKIDEMREIKNGRTQQCLNSQLFSTITTSNMKIGLSVSCISTN